MNDTHIEALPKITTMSADWLYIAIYAAPRPVIKMGSNPQQVKSLVCEENKPIYYKLKIRLSEIPDERILHLEGEEWINAVLANRQADKEFSAL